MMMLTMIVIVIVMIIDEGERECKISKKGRNSYAPIQNTADGIRVEKQYRSPHHTAQHGIVHLLRGLDTEMKHCSRPQH